MLLEALNFMRGNLTISVRGAYIERFLNICAANEIAFWNVKRASCELICADIRTDGFKKLYKYARRAMCRVHIIKKNGLPFFLRKFRKRYALIGGMAVCAAAMFILSGYIWTAEIYGCEKVSQTELMEVLSQNGFYIGMKAADVDCDALRNAVMNKEKDILWMTVNTIGSHAEIFITEREQSPVMNNSKQAADVRAARDGIIVKISAKDGISNVCVGQTVMSGDLLISGRYESQITGVKMMHAEGDIYARTWYNLKERLPHPARTLERTGRKTNKYSLVFGTKRINLYFKDDAPYDKYAKQTRTKRLYLGKKLRLPICMVSQSFYECKPMQSETYYKNAEKIMLAAAEDKLRLIIGEGQVINRKFSVELQNGIYTGVLAAECVENIAREVPVENSGGVQVNVKK